MLINNKNTPTLLFRLIAIAIPFLFFLILELILRIFGFGADYPMVLTDENNPNYQFINTELSLRYFNSREFSTQTQFDLFLKNKTKNTFRIVVKGESTAAGFPYLHGASFPRILEHKLQMRYPDKNIEVINTALAATNSYTLLDIRKEIINLEPDLIIISAGHNEYYGALGVGSTQLLSESSRVVRFYLRLRKIRIVQLLRGVTAWLKPSLKTSNSTDASTLMERMVGSKSIPYRSTVYKAGINQFTSNMSQLLSDYRKYGVPVIITNLVSNYKDHPPFNPDDFRNENTAGVLIKVKELLINRNFKTAQLLLDRIQEDSTNALVQFYYGRSYLLSNDKDRARSHFAKAKDLDLLRFRAPEEFNDLIDQMAKEYDAILVDMIVAFERHSDQEIIGNELLTEHVHPNLKGYQLMADELFSVIVNRFFHDSSSTRTELELESPTTLITEIDSIYGALLVLRLKSTWPFKPATPEVDSVILHFKPTNLQEQLAFARLLEEMEWVEAINRLHDFYLKQRQPEKALVSAMALAQEFNHFIEPIMMAAQNAERLGKINLALFYYTRAYELKEDAEALMGAARMHLKLENYTEAGNVIEVLSKRSPSQMTMVLLQTAKSLPELIIKNQENPSDLKTLQELATAYVILGQHEKGADILNAILKINPEDETARSLMQSLKRSF